MQKDSAERRNKVKIMDRLRVKNEKLSEIEQEQRLKNDTLQRAAMMQLQENEEEIKRLNQVRLYTVRLFRDKIFPRNRVSSRHSLAVCNNRG